MELELGAHKAQDPNDEKKQDDENSSSTLVKAQPAPTSTLLPKTVANAVSFVTRSSSLYIRLGTFIGGLAIDSARVTTLTGLELSRAVIEGIIHRAGKDVANRSTGQVGRLEAEGLLERSITTLHSTITGISFAASAGFHFSSAALSSATDFSQQLLGALDGILGSTDSSRAIASIITLIRREFQNPATGVEGEKVSVGDLLVGICGLALLQRWCRKLTDREIKEHRYEEVIWDVVILNDGRRADVVGKTTDYGSRAVGDTRNESELSFLDTRGDELLQTIERGGAEQDNFDEISEIALKQRILQSLPPNSSVTITTSTSTTKTITVEFSGSEPPNLSPPPGVEIVEDHTGFVESSGSDSDRLADAGPDCSTTAAGKIVYRIVGNRLRSTLIQGPPQEQLDEEENTAHTETTEDTGFTPATSQLSELSPRSEASIRSSDQFPPVLSHLKRATSRSKIPRLSLHPGTSDDENNIDTTFTVFSSDNLANQKRCRKPLENSSPTPNPGLPSSGKRQASKPALLRKAKVEKPPMKEQEKRSTFRQALKRRSSTSLSNRWNKDENKESPETKKVQSRPAWGSSLSTAKPTLPSITVPPRRSSNLAPSRDLPHAPQRGNPNYFSSKDLGVVHTGSPRATSRASYYSVHERRRDSIVSQTDTYSVRSTNQGRSSSPTTPRTHPGGQKSLLRAKSDRDINANHLVSTSSNHRRAHSYEHSIFTLDTNNSATSLVPAACVRKGAFESLEALESLTRTGTVDGSFPQRHIVENITRFVKFASASYGSSFLRMMGISDPKKRIEIDNMHHHEHQSFSEHTQLPADTILLSSFVDPQGGTDPSGHTNTGVPMVHYISLDHLSKAVVLTCRGTLGFEDVLADMTCDYDELIWRGKAYKVHMGIHASARRLLDGGASRVMATLKAALEEYPEYGLVMCGHSLGGGVSALLAVMIAEPAIDGTSFVTAHNQSPLHITNGEVGTTSIDLHLPPGRPIHVYAYGPPATISPSLRLATRGLVTTIVNGQDLVPYLSLGLLHDLQAVALAFKNDDSGAKGEVKSRVWTGMSNSFSEKWYGQPGRGSEEEDDKWAYSALKALRASMLSTKLLPPGEVFMVEAMPVLKRNAFTKDEGDHAGLGKPATRSILKYVRNVEKRFGEVRFGGSMLLDHSPGRYESSLSALARGVLDTGDDVQY
ncbi:hypothetical protein ACMFMG_000337 [Clarireedia jacksonii]